MVYNASRKVRPKKSLGQHFLHDKNTALKIVQALTVRESNQSVLEIGPGTGVLTKDLISNTNIDLAVVEIDRDSVAYLKDHYPDLRILEGDVLAMDLASVFPSSFFIIGNFPYNISSQIFFKILESRNHVDQVVCMLQKEVAERIAAPSGSKTYGILSVLLQTYYTIELLFKVPPGVFTPPPKVMSAVIRLKRNTRMALPCNEEFFVKVVKQGFNNRRKTLRNALKKLILATLSPPSNSADDPVKELLVMDVFNKRAEQLSVDDFINLTQKIELNRGGTGSI